MPTLEIFENAILPIRQGVKELIKTVQARRLDLLGPPLESGLGGGTVRRAVKERRQQVSQEVGAGQGRGLLEQFDQAPLLSWGQGQPLPAQQQPPVGSGQGLVRGPIP